MQYSEIIPLSKSLRESKPSATLLINERSARLISEGKKVYRFGFGQSPFPVPQVVVDALKKNAHHKDYLPVFGLPALREAVATHAHRTLGINIDSDQVVIGPGSKELIFGAQLTLEADLILPSPSWVTYEPQARLVGKEVHWVKTEESEDYLIKPEELTAACLNIQSEYKLLILNYPNNPTGTTYTSDDLQALVYSCKENNIIVISDEIYGEVDHDGDHVSLSQFYPEGTIVSAGLSKWCGAGGWRLGTFIFPKELKWLQNGMRVVASETFSAVAAPIQHAAVAAFKENDEINVYLAHSRKILSDIGNYVHKFLLSIKIRCPHPSGGFYLFPNFEFYRDELAQKGITTSAELCKTLLEETGIALLPGSSFGRQPEELTARLAYVDFDGSKLLSAMQDSDQLNVIQNCPKIIEGLEQLQIWISNFSNN